MVTTTQMHLQVVWSCDSPFSAHFGFLFAQFWRTILRMKTPSPYSPSIESWNVTMVSGLYIVYNIEGLWSLKHLETKKHYACRTLFSKALQMDVLNVLWGQGDPALWIHNAWRVWHSLTASSSSTWCIQQLQMAQTSAGSKQIVQGKI